MGQAFPEPRKIQQVVSALRDGAVVIYPTDTIYGLGCDMFSKKAIERVYREQVVVARARVGA